MIELQDMETDVMYKGRALEMVVDDERDVGEVYLDGDLIFQEMDVYSEAELKKLFQERFDVIENTAEAEDTVIVGGLDSIDEDDEMEDDFDIDDPGYQAGLFSKGGEFITQDGREFIGDYHMHPRKGAMIGKFHTDSPHGALIPVDFETLKKVRLTGKEPATIIDYTVDADYDETLAPEMGDMQDDMQDSEIDYDDRGDFY